MTEKLSFKNKVGNKPSLKDTLMQSLSPLQRDVLKAVAAVLATTGAVACDDDNNGYHLVKNPDAGADANNNTPDQPSNPDTPDTPEDPSDCANSPTWVTMEHFNGCMTTSSLTGAFETGNTSGAFYSNDNIYDSTMGHGKSYVLENDQSCEPLLISAVSNSGTVRYEADRDLNYYLAESALLELIWAKWHNGEAPTTVDLQSSQFGEMLLDVFKCERDNLNCEFKNKLSGGWPTNQHVFTFQHTGPNAMNNGAWCGWMYTIMENS